MSIRANYLKFVLLPAFLMGGLSACDRQGSAEEAGEELDEIFEDEGDMSDGPAENAGEEIDEQTQ